MENNKINTIDEQCEHDILIKKKLITLLKIQLQESQEQIIAKEIEVAKDVMIMHGRLNQTIEKSRKFSLEKLLIDFLPIVDNIERAFKLIEIHPSKNIFLEIFDILKSISDLFNDCFKMFHVKKIDDINVPFNPNVHQAMSISYTNDIESNQIIEVMQPGYILYDSRLLRPAMVIVSKKNI